MAKKRLLRSIYDRELEMEYRFKRFSILDIVKYNNLRCEIINIYGNDEGIGDLQRSITFTLVNMSTSECYMDIPLYILERNNGIKNFMELPDGYMVNSFHVQKLLLSRGYKQYDTRFEDLVFQQPIFQDIGQNIVILKEGTLSYVSTVTEVHDLCKDLKRLVIPNIETIPSRNDLIRNNNDLREPDGFTRGFMWLYDVLTKSKQ